MLKMKPYMRIKFTPNVADGICPRCGSKRFICGSAENVGYSYEEVCGTCGYAMAGNPDLNGMFDVVFSCEGFGAICYNTKDGESVSIPFDSEITKSGARRLFSQHLNRKSSRMKDAKNVVLTWFNCESGTLEEINTSKIIKRAAAKAAKEIHK